MGGPTMHNGFDHNDILTRLRGGDEKAFECLYDHFARRLYGYVYSRVRLKDASEEIVQELFVALWSKRESLHISSSLESYLFSAAKYKILSFMRSEHVRRKYALEFTLFLSNHYDNSVQELTDLHDLQQTLDEKIAELPAKCQTAFRLSRIEHEPIPRIAERMNISTRSVENYITQALRHLRTSLGELLAVLILLAC
jgi:RNA polymerase sigma-70 factor (ECF subfamily)